MSEKTIDVSVNHGEIFKVKVGAALQGMAGLIDQYADENDALTAERDLLRRQLDAAMELCSMAIRRETNGFDLAQKITKAVKSYK